MAYPLNRDILPELKHTHCTQEESGLTSRNREDLPELKHKHSTQEDCGLSSRNREAHQKLKHIHSTREESGLPSTFSEPRELSQAHTFIVWMQPKIMAYPLPSRNQKTNPKHTNSFYEFNLRIWPTVSLRLGSHVLLTLKSLLGLGIRNDISHLKT